MKPDHYLQADRLGAVVAGSDNLVRALLRLHFMAPLVNQALAEAWHGDVRTEGGLLKRISCLLREKTHTAVEDLVDCSHPVSLEEPMTPAQRYLDEGLGRQPTDTFGGLSTEGRDRWKVYDVLDDPLWPEKLRPSLDSRLKELGVELTPDSIAGITEDDSFSLLRELELRGLDKDNSSTTDLIALIEKDFEATARRSLEAEQVYLNRLLSQGAEKQEYSDYDHSGHRGRLVFAALICGAPGIPLGLTENILFLLAAVLAFSGYYFWLSRVKKKSKTYLTVSGTGFVFHRFLLEIPWTAVDYFEVENHIFRNTIIIHTLSAYEFPGVANKNLKWDSSQNKLTIKGVPSHLIEYDINSKAWPAFKNLLARGELERRLREYGQPRWAAGSNCGETPG